MRMSMRSWLRLDQRLTDRYREQARSHRVCRSHIQCGSELARDAFRLFPKFQMRTPAYPLPPDSAHSTPVSTGSNQTPETTDRKSTRLNSSHLGISYAVFCLKKKKT